MGTTFGILMPAGSVNCWSARLITVKKGSKCPGSLLKGPPVPGTHSTLLCGPSGLFLLRVNINTSQSDTEVMVIGASTLYHGLRG